MTRKVLMLAVLLLLCSGTARAGELTIKDVPEEDFLSQFGHDVRLLKAYTTNMDLVLKSIAEEDGLFSRKRTKDFGIEERRKLYTLWASYLDHMLALESVNNYYDDFFVIIDKPRRARAFLLAYASYLAKVSAGLNLVSRTIGNELYEKKLDDAAPAYGIPTGMYARLKWNTIHVNRLTGVHAGYAYYTVLASTFRKEGLTNGHDTAWLFGYIERQYASVRAELKDNGADYFASNGADIVKDTAMAAWFPVQMQVSEWMGDTRVKRGHRFFITREQIHEMDKHLQPGDIVLERRNWYLSNVGLPGFWPHAELYIGSPEELAAFFDDEEVNAHYRTRGNYDGFIDYMRKTHPGEMAAQHWKSPEGDYQQVIEAVSEGVKFSTLEEATEADYVAVLRPRLSKLDIARAIEEAINFLGRLYDFDFDFLTDSTLVCSEVIYKAYLPGPDKHGIAFQLTDIAGHKVLPPTAIAAKYAAEADSDARELDFVYFLEGSEQDQRAFVRDEAAFRASPQRPKWDVAQP
jgi:hypothetical protein